jgi:hypothetical protein
VSAAHSQLADGRRLARAVHANHQNHFRSSLDSLDRPLVRHIQNGQQFFFQEPLEFVHVFNLLAIGFLAKLGQYFVRGGRSQVGAYQSAFKIVERGPVDFFAQRNHVVDALG